VPPAIDVRAKAVKAKDGVAGSIDFFIQTSRSKGLAVSHGGSE